MCLGNCRPHLSLAIGLLLVVVAWASADDKKARSTRPDPAGLTLQMGRFRSLFAEWDLNNDGYLDKAELAKAFRGANAKAYAPSPGSSAAHKSIAAKYPDHEFLIELDQDHDGKVFGRVEPQNRVHARHPAGVLDHPVPV